MPSLLPPPVGTVYETDEEIQQALRVGAIPPPVVLLKPSSGAIPSKPSKPDPKLPPAAVAADIAVKPDGTRAVEPFRPTVRPAAAILVVCDDGRTEGEIIRLRSDRFVIGRTEGNFVIPQDGQISSKHVEITRQLASGQLRWVVTDLNSTNGMFVRVSRAALTDRSEILVGRGRYRLEAPEKATLEHVPAGLGTGGTVGWGSEPPPTAPPALVELVAGGIGNRYVLNRQEYWIGTDASCSICRPDDPFCESRHVRVYCDPSGSWHAEHKKSLNGLWLRVPQITTDKGCQFQVGEQRFRLILEG
jgi:pSer/pThr/pTyr-binding forkhead associated (FHA) protein